MSSLMRLTSKWKKKQTKNELRIIQRVRCRAQRSVRTSSWLFRKERVMGLLRSPLSCKFKCGRDVPANLNVRRWTDWDIQNMGRAKPASGRGTGHNKNQWTVIMDYLWKEVGERGGRPRRHQWTEGIEGAGLRERESERKRGPQEAEEQSARSAERQISQMWSCPIHIY